MQLRKSIHEKQKLENNMDESVIIDCLEHITTTDFELYSIQVRSVGSMYSPSFLAM